MKIILLFCILFFCKLSQAQLYRFHWVSYHWNSSPVPVEKYEYSCEILSSKNKISRNHYLNKAESISLNESREKTPSFKALYPKPFSEGDIENIDTLDYYYKNDTIISNVKGTLFYILNPAVTFEEGGYSRNENTERIFVSKNTMIFWDLDEEPTRFHIYSTEENQIQFSRKNINGINPTQSSQSNKNTTLTINRLFNKNNPPQNMYMTQKTTFIFSTNLVVVESQKGGRNEYNVIDIKNTSWDDQVYKTKDKNENIYIWRLGNRNGNKFVECQANGIDIIYSDSY